MAWSTPGYIEADDPGERVDGAEVRGRFTCSYDEIGFSSVFFLGEGKSKSIIPKGMVDLFPLDVHAHCIWRKKLWMMDDCRPYEKQVRKAIS